MVYDRPNLQYLLWNPVINSKRTECSFDVTPHQGGLASGTRELMSEFLKCLNIEAEPQNWTIEQFCSAYYSSTCKDTYFDRHPIAWRVKVDFIKPYREYSDLELDLFKPIGVHDTNDDTWREWELGYWWQWTSMKYVAIVDFQLWEWNRFLEDFQSQNEPAFALCQCFEIYLLGGLSYQVRFDLGVVHFPEQEAQVMDFLQACEPYDVSTSCDKTMHGW
jgi:hypothetical protein